MVSRLIWSTLGRKRERWPPNDVRLLPIRLSQGECCVPLMKKEELEGLKARPKEKPSPSWTVVSAQGLTAAFVSLSVKVIRSSPETSLRSIRDEEMEARRKKDEGEQSMAMAADLRAFSFSFSLSV